jgi:hypothetical protein
MVKCGCSVSNFSMLALFLLQSRCYFVSAYYSTPFNHKGMAKMGIRAGNTICHPKAANVQSVSMRKKIQGSSRILGAAMHLSGYKSSSFAMIRRVEINEMSESEFQRTYDQEDSLPVLLSGVFSLDREQWCSRLVESIGDATLEYQLRDSNGNTQLLQGPLEAFIENVYSSSHNRSWFALHSPPL